MKNKVLIGILIAFNSCNLFENNTTLSSKLDRFISPPLVHADIPFDEFSIEVEQGDTIFPISGSILVFPPNAFVDKDGSVVDGNIKLKYREFSDPMDFYLSGISMSYDSLNTQYNFESSGMFQVLASKEGKPVYVNPLHKPEIYMVSDNTTDLRNIYLLDTVNKKWVSKGHSVVTDLRKKINVSQNTLYEAGKEPTPLEEPIMPSKPSTQSPVIKIEVDPASIKELLGYHNLQFQVLDNIEAFDPNESNEEWKNVDIHRSEIPGQYIVQFSNDRKTISHTVKPVLEGKDFDKALKIFEKKQIQFAKQKSLRFNKEKLRREQFLKDSVEIQNENLANEKIMKLNLLIEARNKEIERQNQIVEAQTKRINTTNLSNRILRGFNLDSFGVVNFDWPTIKNNPTISAKFTDKSGKYLELHNIAVLYESFKGLIKCNDSNLKLAKGERNFICGTLDGGFAYFSFRDFEKANIDFSKQEQTFVMNIIPENQCNYELIKKLAYE